MQASFISKAPSPKTIVYDAAMHPGGRPTTKKRSPLGERLAQAREQAGISQKDLAAKLGITQPAVAFWERSAANIRSDVLTKIAQALETSVDNLLGTPAQKRRAAVAAAPMGKSRQAFEAVSKLPRRQQDKIIDVVNALVAQASNA